MSGATSGIPAVSGQDLLSTECVLHIVLGYLQPHQLPACALVNSQWYCIAAGYLYRKVPLKRQCLLPQISAICQNIQLGSFIRELRIDTSKLRHSVCVSEEFRQMMSVLCRACTNLKKLWFTYNSEEQLDWVSTLVYSATRLRYLNYDVSNKPRIMFRALINGWEDLETLEITHSATDFTGENDDFISVLKNHPKITQITILGDTHIPDILLVGLTEYCTQLQSLTLGSRHNFDSFSISEKALAKLVQNTTELHTLHLGTTDSSMLLRDLDWLSNVGNHCKQLKSLCWNASFNPSLFPYPTRFRSLLIPFISLTTLNLSGIPIYLVFAMLEGSHAISQTLTTLILKEVGELEEIEEQADYLSQIPSIFPCLKHLELHCYLNQILNRCVPNILQGLGKIEVLVISSIGAVLEDRDIESSGSGRLTDSTTHPDSWFKDQMQSSLWLPNLKYLRLDSIRVTNALISALCRSCPNLVKLYMLSYFSRIYNPIDFSLICSLVTTLSRLNTLHLQWIALEETQATIKEFFNKAAQVHDIDIIYLTPLRFELGEQLGSSSAAEDYEDEFISIKISIHK